MLTDPLWNGQTRLLFAAYYNSATVLTASRIVQFTGSAYGSAEAAVDHPALMNCSPTAHLFSHHTNKLYSWPRRSFLIVLVIVVQVVSSLCFSTAALMILALFGI